MTPGEDVVIDCRDVTSGNGLIVTPSIVPLGETFSVTVPGGGSLPDKIECTLMDALGQPLQISIVDTSGNVELMLKDKFGSMQLESCGDISCLEEFSYTITLSNVGSNDMNVTVVDFTFGNETESFLSEVVVNPLTPGQSISIEAVRVADVCVKTEYIGEVNVEANPPSDKMCQAESMYQFEISPKCAVDASLTCETIVNRTSCADLLGEQEPQCNCTECATEVRFRYTAASCGSLVGCADTGNQLPDQVQIEVYVNGFSFFSDSFVDINGDFVISGGGACVPDTFLVSVSDPVSKALQQTLTVETGCSGGGISLLDSFGSLDFSGYTCSNEEPHNCFVPVEYTASVDNTGTIDITIVTFGLEVNGNITDLLPGDALTLKPGQSYADARVSEVARCDMEEYAVKVAAEADDTSNKGCTDSETLTFGVSVGTTAPSPPSSIPPNSTSTPLPAPVPEQIPPPTMTPISGQIRPPAVPGQISPPTPLSSLAPIPGQTVPPAVPGQPMPSTLAPIPGQTVPPAVPGQTMPSTLAPIPGQSLPPAVPVQTLVSVPPTVQEASAAPSSACILTLDLECTVASGNFEGQSCGTPGIGVEPCRQRPTAATMLYNGGDCEQSDNRQFLKFTCVDTEFGPPPTAEGDRSYIIVTDVKNLGLVYHRGYVNVGENYYLRTPEGEERFEADQRIMIYRNEDTGDPSNLLQEVQYHSSCSSNLELKNRFGASQLVEFQNELQGNVTCFASLSFDLNIVIPVKTEGESATLVKLTALTNFLGFLDLTEQVAGMEILPGGSVNVSLPSTDVDLSQRRRYTIVTQVTATANPSGETCTGTDFNSFFAGNIPPGSVPTRTPTIYPSISPAPTRNPLQTACQTQGVISCEYLNTDGRVVGECDDIPDPRTVSCKDDLQANGLAFRYLGGDGLPSTVFIDVGGGRSGTVFAAPVKQGDIFRADGDFRGAVEIGVSELNADGTAGDTLDTIDVDVNCSGDNTTLTLTSIFGPLELVGFRHALGWRSSVYDLRLQYYIQNVGDVIMVAESALINSDFQTSPVNGNTTDQVIPQGSRVLVFDEERMQFDSAEKFAQNITSTFNMSISGRGEASNLTCSNVASFAF
jgi:hypothetical protein